jgi:hypothetical protein
MLTIVYAVSLAAIALLIALTVAYNRGYQRRDRELARASQEQVRDRLSRIAAPIPLTRARRDHAEVRTLYLVQIGKASRS